MVKSGVLFPFGNSNATEVAIYNSFATVGYLYKWYIPVREQKKNSEGKLTFPKSGV